MRRWSVLMSRQLHHETLYRGADAMPRLGATRVVMCGAGAVGSLLADNLARQGVRRWTVIDRDRVEEHNVGTQLYGAEDVGSWKVEALRNRLFRSTGVEIEAVAKELTERNARKLLQGADVVIDALDNSASRALVQQTLARRTDGTPKTECLHVGLFEDYCEVAWDEQYRVPSDAQGDVCDYPLARNLVLLAVTLASETLVDFLLTGAKPSRTATLRDFAIRDLEPPLMAS